MEPEGSLPYSQVYIYIWSYDTGIKQMHLQVKNNTGVILDIRIL
jgi:hypothetical protein